MGPGGNGRTQLWVLERRRQWSNLGGGADLLSTPPHQESTWRGKKKKESTLPQASVVALSPFSMLADFYGPHLCPRHHSLQRTTVLSPEGPPGALG